MSYVLEWIPGVGFLGAVLLLLVVPPFALIALGVVALAVLAALVALAGRGGARGAVPDRPQRSPALRKAAPVNARLGTDRPGYHTMSSACEPDRIDNPTACTPSQSQAREGLVTKPAVFSRNVPNPLHVTSMPGRSARVGYVRYGTAATGPSRARPTDRQRVRGGRPADRGRAPSRPPDGGRSRRTGCRARHPLGGAVVLRRAGRRQPALRPPAVHQERHRGTVLTSERRGCEARDASARARFGQEVLVFDDDGACPVGRVPTGWADAFRE
jgi:hypothetical protein